MFGVVLLPLHANQYSNAHHVINAAIAFYIWLGWRSATLNAQRTMAINFNIRTFTALLVNRESAF